MAPAVSDHQPNVARTLAYTAALLRSTDDPGGLARALCRRLLGPTTTCPPSRTADQLADLVIGPHLTRPLDTSDVADDLDVEVVLAQLTSEALPAAELCDAVVHYEAQFHLGLVWMQCNRMVSSFPNRTADDLAGWGWLGLRTAVRKFEPALGYRFSTYACFRIAGSIRDGVRDENPVPKRLLTLQRKVTAAEEELSISLGRAPQLWEVAQHLGEALEPLNRLLPRLDTPASLDELAAATSERGGMVEGMVDDVDPADLAVIAMRDAAVHKALSRLEPEDAQVVRLLVCEERSMAEVRRMTGMSDREVRRRAAHGCDELRRLLSDWAPVR